MKVLDLFNNYMSSNIDSLMSEWANDPDVAQLQVKIIQNLERRKFSGFRYIVFRPRAGS